mgnify:CR=1 FL=1
MDTDLKGLVAGILDDLIDARFQADVTVSQLAEHYRADPKMRALSVPSLNISNVDVDLRFVFAETETDEKSSNKPVDEAATHLSSSLAESILRMPSVGQTVKKVAERRKLKKTLAEKVSGQIRAGEKNAPDERQAAIGDEVLKLLSSAKVRISAKERKSIVAEVAAIDARFKSATRVGTPTRARLITAPEALSSVNPEAISRVSFSVDLSAKRWETVESEGEDGYEDQLVDE